MATEWSDWTAEELLDSYWQAEAANADGGWTQDSRALRDELLRRLSAGNSQAENVQITHMCEFESVARSAIVALEDAAVLLDSGDTTGNAVQASLERVRRRYDSVSRQAEPERSDGRIPSCGEPHCEDGWHMVPDAGATPCPNADARTPFALAALERSGEQRETRVQTEACYMTPSCPCSTHRAQAQRSAGRVEAGSKQEQKVSVSDVRNGAVPHNQRNYKP